MIYPYFDTIEEYVDYDIKIGLLSESERQTAIDDRYRTMHKILDILDNHGVSLSSLEIDSG